jgi:phosphoglucosamine mutase
MKKENASLSELVADIRLYPQVLINVPLQDKEHPTRKIPTGGRTDVKSHPMVVQAIKDAEDRLKGRGRLLVRPSGTEHKIRVMVEADEKRLADTLARKIADAIKKTMSV